MKTISEKQEQELRTLYHSMLNKEVTLMVTGERVKGRVLEFKETQHTFGLVVEHEPIRWGDDTFTIAYPSARKCDNWGSLNNVEVVS